MINHLRVTLANRASSEARDASFPGEEFTPPGYAPRRPGARAESVRLALFGGAPDRAYLNFRLGQLLALVHSGPFAGDAFRHDARVTYLEAPNSALLLAAPYVRAVSQSGPGAASFLGTPVPDDASGRIFSSWSVSASPGGVVAAERVSAPTSTSFGTVPVTGGLLDPFPLTGTGVSVAARDGGSTSRWDVEILARPARTLCQVVADLDSLIGVDGGDLLAGPEPYRTWREAWAGAPDTATRLSALALALAERTWEAS